MLQILTTYGYALVFAVVLAENLGLPIPSFALLVAAAAMGRRGHFSAAGLLLVSTVASLAGDLAWYGVGRVRGRPMLRLLCSISLNPDSCVSRTENLFTRHGLKSLLVSKFLPGLNTVAPPLAGMIRAPFGRFSLFALMGTLLWASAALALGACFRAQLEWVLVWLDAFGGTSAWILGVLLAGWVLLKWVERRRFYRLLERSRIAPPELKEMLDRGAAVAIVDLRSDLGYQSDGLKILGSIHIPPKDFDRRYSEIPAGRPVVMYCT